MIRAGTSNQETISSGGGGGGDGSSQVVDACIDIGFNIGGVCWQKQSGVTNSELAHFAIQLLNQMQL